MDRRTFLCGLTLGMLAALFGIEAQQGKPFVIQYENVSRIPRPSGAILWVASKGALL